MLHSIRSRAVAGLAVVSFVSAGFVLLQPRMPQQCPAGYKKLGKDLVESAGITDAEAAKICVAQKHPELFAEIREHRERQAIKVGRVPEGAYRRAIEQKKALEHAKAEVPGAAGTWEEYGVGSLIVTDPQYNISGTGIGDVNGRVDSLVYDVVNERLFAAVSTGGIWMSTDLAETWTNIGQSLPSLAVGAVGWTPAGGGTLIVAGGEPTLGSSFYSGLGSFWSNDLGQTWHQGTGIPDSAAGFQVAVDQSRPEIVYVANSKGLFRSEDAGRSFTNVALPTSNQDDDCTGVTDLGPCQFSNVVTDVVVQTPGGSTNVTCAAAGCPVVASIGYLYGHYAFPDGRPRGPNNGLYKSSTGAPGTFERLNVSGVNNASPVGFATQNRTGRIEMAAAIGEDQDHNFLYAIVQDSLLMFGTVPTIDVPLDIPPTAGGFLPIVFSSVLNGIYVSSDFGESWTRMADTIEISQNPASGSSLSVPTPLTTLGYQPGVQAWYDMWVRPDPTVQSGGVPTRLAFGLEEVWKNTLDGIPQDGVAQAAGAFDFRVIGTYFAGDSCLFLSLGLPVCPTNNPPTTETTTHPDQHASVFVPTDNGGVCLIVGNDGGVYKQCVGPGEEMDNTKWGTGANDGFYTLLPYHMAAAKDGTVWSGLQDNGTAKIVPDTRQQYMTYGGDGTYVAVDPDNGNIAYGATPGGAMIKTTDGGVSWSDIPPPVSGADFVNPFKMDPTDANHLIVGGPEIMETLDGADSWIQVFNVGAEEGGAARTVTNLAVRGDNAYAAFARVSSFFFNNGIATNVGGEQPPQRGTGAGWHIAAAAGLPKRYITAIEMDPANPRNVYVTLAGYVTDASPPGGYGDINTHPGNSHVFKSTDAGETFTDISGDMPDVNTLWVTLHGSQLVIGTDLGAFISSDLNGTRWSPLGNGMPNVPVTAMQIDPADSNQLYAATYGRGIWKYRFTGLEGLPIPGGGVTPTPTRGVTEQRFGGALPLPGIALLLGLALARRRKALL